MADAVRDERLISTGEKVLIATWHDGESLVDYLWFVAFFGHPEMPLSAIVAEIGDYLNEDLLVAVREVLL